MRRGLIILTMLCLFQIGNAIDLKRKGDRVAADEITADSLLSGADSTFQSGDYETALEQYRAAFESAQEEFNRPVEVEALSQMARMNLILSNKEDGRNWLDKARERADKSDPLAWSRYLGVRGRFEWQEDDLKTAQATFLEMYDYCNANALWGRAVDAAHMIAIVSESPNEQIEWGRRGIEAAEANEVESWLGPLWNNLAGTYYDMKQYDSALECYHKAREYHWRFSGEVAKLFADYHVGMTYRLLGEYEEAARWLRPVLAWAERLQNHSAAGQACQDLGEVAIAQGRPTEGLELLKRALVEYRQAGFEKTWPQLIENVGRRIAELEP